MKPNAPSPSPSRTYVFDSLAAKMLAAGDLAGNLLALFEALEVLRHADGDTPPTPTPAWWDGYVDFTDWQMRVRGQRRPPSRHDRVLWAGERARNHIKFILDKWSVLTEPLATTEADKPLFMACRESLRNMGGILLLAQEGQRLHYGVVPVCVHLAAPLPGVWDPESESDAEKQSLEAVMEEAHTAVTGKGAAAKAAQARLKKSKAERTRLGLARDERNRLGRQNAEREGRVSSSALAAEKAKRADWEVQIGRWEQAEAHVQDLLDYLIMPQHPTLRLLNALNRLNFVFGNVSLYQDLAKRRRETWDRHIKMLNAQGKALAAEANALGRAGAPFQEQFAALLNGHAAHDRVPTSNEPPNQAEFLAKHVIEPGRRWTAHGRGALRDGGAKVYDAATQPNALGQKRSIELHTRFQEAEGMFAGLWFGVNHPHGVIDKYVEQMEELRVWCKRVDHELAAVIETEGLGPSSQSSLEVEQQRAPSDVSVEIKPAKSARRAKSQVNPSIPAPRDIHFAIMRYLRDQACACYRTQIADALKHHGRTPIHDGIAAMHLWGYVHAPPKARSGIVLLPPGRKALEDYERAAREQSKNKAGTKQ